MENIWEKAAAGNDESQIDCFGFCKYLFSRENNF